MFREGIEFPVYPLKALGFGVRVLKIRDAVVNSHVGLILVVI